MTTLCIRGGRVVDPANGVDAPRDLHVRDGRIVDGPDPADPRVEEVDASGCVVMAGGIDLHTHIGGGKVNLARLLMTEDHRGSGGGSDGTEGGATVRSLPLLYGPAFARWLCSCPARPLDSFAVVYDVCALAETREKLLHALAARA